MAHPRSHTLAAAALAAAFAFCHTARAEDRTGAGDESRAGDELTRLEDAADALDPAEAVRAYFELRRLVTEKPGAASPGVIRRISLKLKLAEGRTRASDPAFPERLALSRQAAEIGGLHLEDGDPARAVAWEGVCHAIEPRSTYAPALHTRIHEWFEAELRSRLDAHTIAGAREVLHRWRSLLGDEHATRTGLATYAEARAGALREGLGEVGARRTLLAVADEESAFPDRPVWSQLRREVAASLQRPFDAAVAAQDSMRSLMHLEAQREIAGAFPSMSGLLGLADNETRLDALDELLQPEPLLRPYGHVRHTSFTLTLTGAPTASEFRDRTESISATETAWAVDLLFRQRAAGRRRFAGAEVTGANLTASDGIASATALVVRTNYVFGSVGRTRVTRAGVGVAYAAVEYAGLALTDRGSGAVYGNVTASVDLALGRSVVASGAIQLAYTDELSTVAASLSLAYHANANFAVGVRAFMTRIRAEEEASALDLEVAAAGIGLTAKVQF